MNTGTAPTLPEWLAQIRERETERIERGRATLVGRDDDLPGYRRRVAGRIGGSWNPRPR